MFTKKTISRLISLSIKNVRRKSLCGSGNTEKNSLQAKNEERFYQGVFEQAFSKCTKDYLKLEKVLKQEMMHKSSKKNRC